MASSVGGNLTENLISILGKFTFPDPSASGKPVCPMTVRVGFQVLLINELKVLLETGWEPSRKGKADTAYFPFI